MPASIKIRLVRFFLSYAHDDAEFVRDLARALSRKGGKVWIDFAEMRSGDSLVDRITEAVVAADYIIAVVSSTSVSSRWCKKELAIAITRGLEQGRVNVMPVKLGNVAMPPNLCDVFYVDTLH